ncbi:MAG TPA: GNAT family N-acetyltransferase [Candidatus Acetothermia bacterium]|nr:GNAT family N-acetyltransferase [Candidatus Bipolaricaulota bacterium]RLE38165.1 MAG: hypothetical protein DRJ23_05025 [Candidatus Acetothermia bacterium]HDJ29864.1 GNAT family N-acetyltransferase [Candidatus Acetothermia bacterium]
MGRYTIRAMEQDDAEAVARLARLFEPISTTIFRGIPAPDACGWVREHLARPGWAGFVATAEDGEVVGFALCKDLEQEESEFVFPEARKTIQLVYLAVDEAFRGQGIASALIRACEDLAKKLGRTGVLLDVSEQNPAINLYRRLGFKRLGAQVFMRKELDQ